MQGRIAGRLPATVLTGPVAVKLNVPEAVLVHVPFTPPVAVQLWPAALAQAIPTWPDGGGGFCPGVTFGGLPWEVTRPVAWSNVAMVAFPVAMLVFAVCLTFDIGPRGLVQRTSAACQLAWLVALAMRPDRGLTARSLRRGAAAPSS